MEYTDMNYTICFCNHLTHFGVLLVSTLWIISKKVPWHPTKSSLVLGRDGRFVSIQAVRDLQFLPKSVITNKTGIISFMV